MYSTLGIKTEEQKYIHNKSHQCRADFRYHFELELSNHFKSGEKEIINKTIIIKVNH